MEKIIYAIIDSGSGDHSTKDPGLDVQGISGSELYILPWQNISAAVSNYTSSGSSITRDHAIDYARVIEELSQQYTLLPIRFGTVVKSDEIIIKLLADHYDAFVTNLQTVKNKYEFGLKVIWDYAKCSEKIRVKLENEDLDPTNYFKKNTVNTNYLLEKIKIHRLEDALLKHVEELIAEIVALLEQINPDCKFKKMSSQNIILDAVFLVEKPRITEFQLVIKSLKQQHDDLDFLLTGPWPPYSFINITIDQ